MKRVINACLTSTVLLAAAVGFAAADANVYVVHGVPDVPVDVYVNGDGPVLEGFEFTMIAGPLALPAGEYEIDVYVAGTEPDDADPAIERTVTVVDGQNVALVAHLTEASGLAITPFGIDATAPKRGASRLGLRHVAAAPPVDLIVSTRQRFVDNSVVIGLTNGAGAMSAVPAGPVRVVIALPGTTAAVVPEIALTLEPGKVYVAYAVGSLLDESFQVLAQVIEPVIDGMEDDYGRDAKPSRRSFGRRGF